MILLIDNYDSFSYNLVQLVGSLTAEEIRVIRNDARTVREIEKAAPSHIILSPGPGRPKDAGICEETVRTLKGRIPILGVCLGHQGICEAFGARITYAPKLMHGKQSIIRIDTQNPLFAGLPQEIRVARYHSLVADPATLPDELQIIARTEEQDVMAVCHREFPVYGLQFHPESVLTPDGAVIMKNFLYG
ncbi:anthranilate synthase component II [Diplocloster agilis]|uniref:Aminodeoxychorismate/anthranilate synthase component II n=1 Tax=Diplocloster agilis TaxID=2850323 RepID=A0A949K7L6_9FIRM|nr:MULTISPECIES: aminodeoxychorismate/anthranilate synthase component II [Lachnospiraceae]MBU9737998.1 aminodeoxychorismate/anthranilate synthase component II [Diplocloster agilis]MBU9745649.1 aminodeoxychorismate/anthranilate synthase component II [Diplocloster agilis]MCU6732665.1 aminodeoxychorismate/anthranilate synthase component II [Suonthocola fibrivorans]SCI56481.1 Para-aminobenzoate synthase glutamine amidotransferase component II [uncultured Clostridium sp.]